MKQDIETSKTQVIQPRGSTVNVHEASPSLYSTSLYENDMNNYHNSPEKPISNHSTVRGIVLPEAGLVIEP